MKVTRVYLVRNGGTSVERPGQFVGQLDHPLSPEGKRRMERLLEVFKDERVDKVYTSTLARARQSAAIFADFYGLEAVSRDDLKEIDLGEFEGKTFEEITEESPERAKEMSAAPVQFTYPGGESFLTLGERAYRAFWKIVTRSEGERVMVFSHAGVNRAILASILGILPEGIFKIEQDPAGVSLVEVVDRFPRLKFLNVTVR